MNKEAFLGRAIKAGVNFFRKGRTVSLPPATPPKPMSMVESMKATMKAAPTAKVTMNTSGSKMRSTPRVGKQQKSSFGKTKLGIGAAVLGTGIGASTGAGETPQSGQISTNSPYPQRGSGF